MNLLSEYKRHIFLQIEKSVSIRWAKVLEHIILMKNMLATMSHSITMTVIILIKAIVNVIMGTVS